VFFVEGIASPLKEEILPVAVAPSSQDQQAGDRSPNKENVLTQTVESEVTKEEGGSKRKKILDLVRLGVVMVETKTYASTESEKTAASMGTGFIVDKAMGLIATNRHVVGDMTVSTYSVKFSNGTRTSAQLVYFDPLYDFAFIKVDPTKLPKDAVSLELSQKSAQVNASIYCMGNSGKDEFSTFLGTVFSIYENLGPFAEQSFSFSGLTIPGASGSPVFDQDGKVIGIVYGGKVSSGSALPISYLRDALKALQSKKTPVHRSLGIVPNYVSLDDVTKAGLIPLDAMQKYLNDFPHANNKILLINARLPGTKALELFQAGDILWSVNKQIIGPNLYELDRIVNEAGDKDIAIEVYRQGKLVSFKIKSYSLNNDHALNMVTFMDTTWIMNNEFIKLFVGHGEEGVFALGLGQTSPLRSITGQLPGFFMDTRLLKIVELDGKPLKTLQDLVKIIPTLSDKRELKIKYIDFIGMVGLGTFAPADRQERLAVINYESKFDSPKLFKFDTEKYEWQTTDIVAKKDEKPTTILTKKGQ